MVLYHMSGHEQPESWQRVFEAVSQPHAGF
jgi:hypothetical protein